MTIKQNRKTGVCYSSFEFEGRAHNFTFNGKKGQPLITSKREAKEYEAELKRKMKSRTFVASTPLQNFERFYKEVFCDYTESRRADLTREFDAYYGENLVEEFGRLRLSQITAKMVEEFLARLARRKTKGGRNMSPVTVRMHFDRLSQMFNLAVRDRYCEENPCKRVRPSVLEQFPRWIPRERWLNKFDPEEESKLFAELDGRLQVVCRLLLNTGLRPPKEILLAEKGHVNLTGKSASYRFTGRDGAHLAGQRVLLPPRSLLVAHGKDRTTRAVPLNDAAAALLEVLCGDAAAGPYLFARPDGSPVGSMKKGFSRACARAGIEDLRPYDLRHTFATRLQERYVHPFTISELLGHARGSQGFGQGSRVTPNYSHATWEGMRRAVESLAYEPSQIVFFGEGSGRSREKEAKAGAEEASAKAG